MVPDQASMGAGELGKDDHNDGDGSDIRSHKHGLLGGHDVPQPGHRVERRRPALPLAAQLCPGMAAMCGIMWQKLNKTRITNYFCNIIFPPGQPNGGSGKLQQQQPGSATAEADGGQNGDTC